MKVRDTYNIHIDTDMNTWQTDTRTKTGEHRWAYGDRDRDRDGAVSTDGTRRHRETKKDACRQMDEGGYTNSTRAARWRNANRTVSA